MKKYRDQKESIWLCVCVCVQQCYFFWSLLWFLLTEHCDPAADGLGRRWHQVEALAANLSLVVCRSDLQLENAGRSLLLDVFLPNRRHNLAVLICRRGISYISLFFWQGVKKANHTAHLDAYCAVRWVRGEARSFAEMGYFVSVTECHKASSTDGGKDLPWSSGDWLEGFHHETHTSTGALSPLWLLLSPDPQ